MVLHMINMVFVLNALYVMISVFVLLVLANSGDKGI